MVQVIVIESLAPLLTTENTVRHSSVPPEELFKTPASVIAPVPVPAANDATYSTVFELTVVLVRA